MTEDFGGSFSGGSDQSSEGAVSPSPANSDHELLQFFSYGHLPEHLRVISAEFHQLAHKMMRLLPDNAQRDIALQHLLTSKDAAVRAKLQKR